jgi:hypothetical protein
VIIVAFFEFFAVFSPKKKNLMNLRKNIFEKNYFSQNGKNLPQKN